MDKDNAQQADLGQVGSAPGAAPVENTPAQPAAEQTAQPDIQAALEQVMAARDEQLYRWLQSQLDKREASIWKRMNAQGEAIKKAKTLGLSDEHLAALRDAGLLNEAAAMAEEADEDEPDEGDGVNAITAAGQEIAAQYGLTMADPETRMVVIDGTPAQYLQSIVQAGKAKQARTQVAPAQPPAAQAVPAPAAVSAARIPGVAVSGGGAPTNPIAHVKSAGDLYKLAAQDMRTKRQNT